MKSVLMKFLSGVSALLFFGAFTQDHLIVTRPDILITKPHLLIKSGKLKHLSQVTGKPHAPLQIEIAAPSLETINSGEVFDLRVRVHGFIHDLNSFTLAWTLPENMEVVRGLPEEHATTVPLGKTWETTITLRSITPSTAGSLFMVTASFDGPLGRLGATQQVLVVPTSKEIQTQSSGASSNPVKFYQ